MGNVEESSTPLTTGITTQPQNQDAIDDEGGSAGNLIASECPSREAGPQSAPQGQIDDHQPLDTSLETWRPCTPKPFARRLRLHMDACAGTNKS